MGNIVRFMIDIIKNYNKYKAFITELVDTNLVEKSLLMKFIDNSFVYELEKIDQCTFLIESTSNLEAKKLTTCDQIVIIKDLGDRLENYFLFEKYNLLVEKNPDLNFFFKLNPVTCQENENFICIYSSLQ
ncbi:hypothetical protein DMUE_4226 [Dictyocoela muelleri]|nr:hypothetical protein DMUE_4226 [Dictyocoela muelleri]